jgi:hypothetical protein
VSGSPVPTESIECPLCLGTGNLKRTEILDRLGVKDFARVAQLSAEEAFRLLQSKHDREHQSAWSRFETELAKRTAEIRECHKDELRSAQSDRDDLTRRIENCLREVAQLRERNQDVARQLLAHADTSPRSRLFLEADLLQFSLVEPPWTFRLRVRFNALSGAARAAKLSGDQEKAKTYYAKLLAICQHADGDRPELQDARSLLAQK